MNPASSSIGAAPVRARRNPSPDLKQISAIYRIRCAEDAVESLGRDIAFEQTVEVPESLVTSETILQQIVGRVEEIRPAPGWPGSFLVKIGYNVKLSGYQIPQLLNLIYGNCSLKTDVALVDVDLPDEFLSHFRGPNFGVDGIRELLDVHDRPLLSTALKPMGSSAAEFAALAYEFSLGGGDLVKDDHNLHDESFEAFRERVARCHEAVTKANAKTGRNALYLPNILAPVDQLEKYLDCVMSLGIRGVLVAPFVLGFDVTRHIAEKYRLVMMAHPTVTGAFFRSPHHGIEPGILLGKLFRLIGADVSIFPNAGGRFTFTPADCRNISEHLRAPLGDLKAALPAPAGGMRFDNLAEMSEQYGPDAVFLIGGALLSHSDSLEQSTRDFLRRIQKCFASRAHNSPAPFASSCELPHGPNSLEEPATELRRLAFNGDFTWNGRKVVVYKSSGEIPFRDVSRQELIGQHGEQTSFDLRYFQIEPGGFSSLEKHGHTHAILCVRGEGTLISGPETFTLKHFDIAYVPPFEVHQLRNEGTTPFGFFCIVDHDRDRPIPP